MAGQHVYREPRIPGHDPICLLDKETALKRAEPSDRLLSDAPASYLPNGVEYRLNPTEATWSRVLTYIEEERQCCPSLAFEALVEEQAIRLIVFQPFEDQVAPSASS